MSIEVKNFVEALFEESTIESEDLEWPDDFDDLDAVALIEAINAEHQRSKRKIFSNPYAEAERINALLAKYAEARPKVTGEVFDKAFAALSLSFDYGVMGAEAFCPKVLGNGGLLFRNHHRVLAIDEQPTDVIRVHRDVLRAQLADFAATYQDTKDTPSFFILHRDEQQNSQLIRTQKVPQTLNGKGQTLVFLDHTVDLSSLPCLAGSKIQSCMKDSRSGFAMIQVYRDMVFLYGMYRESDEYDVLLEEYATHIMDEFDEPVELRLQEDAQLSETIAKTRDFVESTDLAYQTDDSVMGHYVGRLIHSYAAEKYGQIQCVTPRFVQAGDSPVQEFSNQPDYSEVSLALDYRAVMLEFGPSSFWSIEQFEKSFSTWFGTTAQEEFGPNLLAVELLTVPPEDFDPAHKATQLVSLTSPEANEYLKETAQQIHTEISIASREAGPGVPKPKIEAAVWEESDFLIVVVMSFQELPFPEEVNDFASFFSARQDACLQAVIPALGFEASYVEGDGDEGNSEKFIPKSAEPDAEDD